MLYVSTHGRYEERQAKDTDEPKEVLSRFMILLSLCVKEKTTFDIMKPMFSYIRKSNTSYFSITKTQIHTHTHTLIYIER